METFPEGLFSTLADPTRGAIFERLCRDGEQTVGALTARAGVATSPYWPPAVSTTQIGHQTRTCGTAPDIERVKSEFGGRYPKVDVRLCHFSDIRVEPADVDPAVRSAGIPSALLLELFFDDLQSLSISSSSTLAQ